MPNATKKLCVRAITCVILTIALTTTITSVGMCDPLDELVGRSFSSQGFYYDFDPLTGQEANYVTVTVQIGSKIKEADSGVMEYYQSMVVLGDPVGLNMESVSAPVAPPVVPIDPVVTDPSASPIASHDKVLAAYFPEWGIYGRDYQLADVPADELTHLIYAFADLNASGEMTLFDSYAATEKRFSAEESVTGLLLLHWSFSYHRIWQGCLYVCLEGFTTSPDNA